MINFDFCPTDRQNFLDRPKMPKSAIVSFCRYSNSTFKALGLNSSKRLTIDNFLLCLIFSMKFVCSINHFYTSMTENSAMRLRFLYISLRSNIFFLWSWKRLTTLNSSYIVIVHNVTLRITLFYPPYCSNSSRSASDCSVIRIHHILVVGRIAEGLIIFSRTSRKRMSKAEKIIAKIFNAASCEKIRTAAMVS